MIRAVDVRLPMSAHPAGTYGEFMYLENLVIDAVEPRRLGRFWEAVVGGERLTDEPDGFETRLTVEDGPVLDLCFQRVSEPPAGPSVPARSVNRPPDSVTTIDGAARSCRATSGSAARSTAPSATSM